MTEMDPRRHVGVAPTSSALTTGRGRVKTLRDQYNHWSHYYEVLSEVLDDARDGLLTPDWRQLLREDAATELASLREAAAASQGTNVTEPDSSAATLVDSARHTCLVDGVHGSAVLGDLTDDRIRLISLYLCAVIDVTELPAADWEPYATGGNWRRALDSWRTERVLVIEGQLAVPGLVAFRGQPAVRRTYRHLRADVEAKYLAGIAFGTGQPTRWSWHLADGLEPADFAHPPLDSGIRRQKGYESLPLSWLQAVP